LRAAITPAVRAAFAKHIEKIVLTPKGESYIATGTWGFVRGRYGGAGGPISTTRKVAFEVSLAA